MDVLIDSFLTCSGDAGIKRSRYAHQLTLASFATLANEAFKSQTGYTDFKAWKATKAREKVYYVKMLVYGYRA